MQKKPLSAHIAMLLTSCTLALGLSACGGGGSSDNATSNNQTGNDSNTPPKTTASFTESAEWHVDSSKLNTNLCYDFDSKSEVDCQGKTWDIKFENKPRNVKLWSNSGNTGQKGAVFGLIDWKDLKQYKNATHSPTDNRDISHHYVADKSGSIFDQYPWFEYNINNKHFLYANNRVYLITTDSSVNSTASSVQIPVYALQIINYYGANSKSGQPHLRWIDTAMPDKVNNLTVDASSYTTWKYIDLKTGKEVTASDDWHIAVNRLNIKLNGGTSGKGKVAGLLAKTPDGYYDKDGKPIAKKFASDNRESSLADLTNVNGYNIQPNKITWIKDEFISPLNPTHTGQYPNLDFGWYTYDGKTHKLVAKPEATAKGALIRSAEGNSYARMRLDKIEYANENIPQATKWIFKLDIQPAS